jgi:hypothetical protein
MYNKKENKKFDVWGWIISAAVAVVVFLIGNWLCIPTIGWSLGMLLLTAVSIGLGFVASAIYAEVTFDYEHDNSNVTRMWILGIAAAVVVVAIIISAIASITWFHVDEVKDRLDMSTISQEELIEKLPDVDESGAYSWVDSTTAKNLAARKMGELTDLVSLYTTDDVNTTVSNGKIVKYVPLAYGGFFKAMKVDTIPGYIVVDPVTQKAEYVECSFSYAPSAFFGKDLMRHVRKNFPNDYLGNYSFQVSPDGIPYWVCELQKTRGSWAVKETYAVALVNAQTGACEKHNIGETPEWVSAIYGTTAMDYYNGYGSFINGWWNPSQFGETSTTDNFGYVAIDGDLYYYTGITSAVIDGGDEANLGVLLYNAHTDKAYYCQVAGAEEYSAMGEAEDVVKNFGYKASFPSLTSVDGVLTYTMVLKGDNGTTKQYAMVNYENYSIAVSADTLSACVAAYNKAMAQNGNMDNGASNWTEIDIAVNAIEYIVQGGETTVYIRDTDGKVYKAAFDERFLFVETGDTLTLQVIDDSAEIKVVIYSNLVEIEDVPEDKTENVEGVEAE